MFHKRGQVEPEAFNLCKEAIERAASRSSLKEIIILTGNHDITMEGEVFNTAYMLQGVAGITTVITEPTLCPSKSGEMEVFIPFCKEGFETHVAPSKAKDFVLYMHQSVFGASYNRPILKGVDPKLLKNFKRVYCGHIHEPQVIGKNIYIVGAPYPMNFGDKKHHRVLIDTGAGLPATYRIEHPEFITVDDPSQISNDGNFYRLVTDAPPDESVGSNVRVVVKPKLKEGRKIKAATDRELLEEYARREGIKDKDIKKMVDVGIKFLEDK